MLDKVTLIENALLRESYYMNWANARRFIATRSNIPNREAIAKDSSDPKNKIIYELRRDPQIVNQLEDYEFETQYKYCVLYKCEGINFNTLRNQFIKDGAINTDNQNEVYSHHLYKPLLKDYNDSFDLKFSLVHQKFKYPVILTFFGETKIIALKYGVIGELLNGEDSGYYSDLNEKVQTWMSNNIHVSVVKAETMSSYKEIFLRARAAKIEEGELKEIDSFKFSSDDIEGGSTAIKITEESGLPLIDSFTKLTEEFESENDKRRVLDLIDTFLKESTYNKIGLFWWAVFHDSRGQKVKIKVIAEKKFYSTQHGLSSYCQIHFYSKDNLNRNRINYVISKISEYL